MLHPVSLVFCCPRFGTQGILGAIWYNDSTEEFQEDRILVDGRELKDFNLMVDWPVALVQNANWVIQMAYQQDDEMKGRI